MITPEYLNEVIQGVELAVNRLNNQLLKEVVKKIVEAFYTGKDILMPSTINKLHQIVQSGYRFQQGSDVRHYADHGRQGNKCKILPKTAAGKGTRR